METVHFQSNPFSFTFSRSRPSVFTSVIRSENRTGDKNRSNQIKALSSFIPGNGNNSTYYILHSDSSGSIKIQKFEKNDQEYTTENMGELACPTDTGDEQSCTSIDVHYVTRLDSYLFFLSRDDVSSPDSSAILPLFTPPLHNSRRNFNGIAQLAPVLDLNQPYFTQFPTRITRFQPESPGNLIKRD